MGGTLKISIHFSGEDSKCCMTFRNGELNCVCVCVWMAVHSRLKVTIFICESSSSRHRMLPPNILSPPWPSHSVQLLSLPSAARVRTHTRTQIHPIHVYVCAINHMAIINYITTHTTINTHSICFHCHYVNSWTETRCNESPVTFWACEPCHMRHGRQRLDCLFFFFI